MCDRLLYTYVTCQNGTFSEAEKKDLREFLERRVKKADADAVADRSGQGQGEGEVLGLTREEVGVLRRAVE